MATMADHNHLTQAPYPDSLLEDCPACATIRPEVRDVYYALRAINEVRMDARLRE